MHMLLHRRVRDDGLPTYNHRLQPLSEAGDFLNLEALSVGNTTLETIDLSANPHLQRLNLQNALWINTLILAPDCNPEILYPQGIDSVTIERK